MNYCTQAIEFFRSRMIRALLHNGKRADADASIHVISELEQAVKFLLPSDANVGIEISAPVMNLIRAPYPVLAFECDMHPRDGVEWKAVDGYTGAIEPSTKRIALVWRVDPKAEMTNFAKQITATMGDVKDKIGILVCSLFFMSREGKEFWLIAPGMAFVELGTMDVAADEAKNGAMGAISITLFDLMRDMTEELLDYHGGDVAQVNLSMSNDLADEIGVAIRGLAAINARNVHHVTIEAPAKLNAKRRRNGKTEFFEYKILDIFLGGDRTIRHRDRVASAMANLRMGVKLHGVRGHFKERKTGIFWWSDFLRGSKHNGVVEKEYRVTNKERS